jgi:DNA polymerase-3 subunit beta
MLHIKILTEDLSRSVGLANTVTDRRTTMPILSNVLIKAEDNYVDLTATDLQITTHVRIPAEVIEPGQVTVPAKYFSEVIRNVSGDQVILRETEDSSTILSSGTFSSTFFGLSPENYPHISPFTSALYSRFDGPQLIDAINKTINSVAGSDDTYNLAGIFFIKEKEDEFDTGKIRLVSTDAQRLNLATLSGDELENLDIENGIIVPRKGCLAIKNIAESAPTVSFALAGNTLAAKTPEATVVISLLEGPYPDYKLIIPKDNDLIVWFYRRDFLEVLKRLHPLFNKDYQLAKFTFTRDLLTVVMDNPEIGHAEETLGIEYDGPAIEAGFNLSFFAETLNSMNSERISFVLKEGRNAYLMTGQEDPGYFGVFVSAAITK